MTAGARGPVVVIMLTHRDPPLVRRVVSRILEGRNVAVVVHHDPRGPELELPRSSQVLTVPNPARASWGRMALADSVLNSLSFAAERIPDMSWALVVSGQDYPCRPMPEIEDELAATDHDAYVRWFKVGDASSDVVHWQSVARARYLHRIRIPGSHHHVPAPRLHPFRTISEGSGVDLFIGDMWCNLSAAAIDHVTEQRARLKRVTRYLSRCQIPDEALLPTFLLNGAHNLDIANDRKRYIRWVPGSAHPATLSMSDASLIRAGRDFFARKVDLESGAALLDRLDEAASLHHSP